MSLMLRHQKKFQGGGTVVESGAKPPAAAGSLNERQLSSLLDASLSEDMKGLSSLKSRTAKEALKRDKILPKYEGYVARLMSQGWEHDLLLYYMLWAFDAGLIEQAMKVGFHCIETGQVKMPGDFKRDVYSVVADGVADWAEDAFGADRSCEPYFSGMFDVLIGADENDEPWDIPDQLAARFYRLKGLLEEKAGNDLAAQKSLEKALEMGAQVKTKLKEIVKRLEAAKAAEAEKTEGSGDSAK